MKSLIKSILPYLFKCKSRVFEVKSKEIQYFRCLDCQNNKLFIFPKFNFTKKLSIGNFLEEISFEKMAFRTKGIVPAPYFNRADKRMQLLVSKSDYQEMNHVVSTYISLRYQRFRYYFEWN